MESRVDLPECAQRRNSATSTRANPGRRACPASGLYFLLKVAVTVISAVVRVTTQVPVPWHPPPLQPINPEAGVAVRVT
jgi:hypothetical protein